MALIDSTWPGLPKLALTCPNFPNLHKITQTWLGSAWLSLALVISLSQCTGACWEFAPEPINCILFWVESVAQVRWIIDQILLKFSYSILNELLIFKFKNQNFMIKIFTHSILALMLQLSKYKRKNTENLPTYVSTIPSANMTWQNCTCVLGILTPRQVNSFSPRKCC